MIHAYQLNGYNIVLDIFSGSVHITDDLVYDVVTLLKDDPKETVLAALSAEDGSVSLRDETIAALSSRYEIKDITDAFCDVLSLIESGKLFCDTDPAEKLLALQARDSKAVRAPRPPHRISKTPESHCIPAALDTAGTSGQDVGLSNSPSCGGIPACSSDEAQNCLSCVKADGAIKALCLNVAHSCNLTCSYCFAGQGRYKGKSALMPLETGKRAIDFLIEHSAKRRNLEVDFFGGEPLLNWQMVKDTVAYARSVEDRFGKHFRFTLTTNGLLIDDDVIDFTNREMDNVVLSLDGRKTVHDRFRVDSLGHGSYDVSVPKFQELVRRRTRGTYYMRGTFTHYNADFLNDIRHLFDLGFNEISMEPVVSPPGTPHALTPDDLDFVKEQYEALALEMIRRRKAGKPFTFYHYMMDLEHGPCLFKRLSGCGSGTEYFAVTPSGDLYPCHQLIDNPAFRMGHLNEGITNKALQNEYRRCNLYAREECRSCWAQLYCSGGCAANAFHTTGSLFGVYKDGCDLFRKRIECALMVKASEALDA